jgi:hypothetical protein
MSAGINRGCRRAEPRRRGGGRSWPIRDYSKSPKQQAQGGIKDEKSEPPLSEDILVFRIPRAHFVSLPNASGIRNVKVHIL